MTLQRPGRSSESCSLSTTLLIFSSVRITARTVLTSLEARSTDFTTQHGPTNDVPSELPLSSIVPAAPTYSHVHPSLFQ